MDNMQDVEQVGHIIKDELDYQNQELLPEFEGNVDKVKHHIQKTNKSMDTLTQKSSKCCLILIIIAELIILGLVLWFPL
jgi:hypothetical protein